VRLIYAPNRQHEIVNPAKIQKSQIYPNLLNLF